MGISLMEALRRTTRSIASCIPNSLAVQDNKLFLAKDLVPIPGSEGVEIQVGSGGSSGGTGYVQLINKLPSTSITTSIGSAVELAFAYTSSEGDNGTAYIYVNESLKGTYSIVAGENTIDISSLLGSGINVIKLTATDAYGNSRSLNYTVDVVELKVTSTFDDSQLYSGDVHVRIIPYGSVSKDVHFVIDSVDTVVATTSETSTQQTYTISGDKLVHGAHDLTIYLSAEVNGITITSNKLQYSIIAVDEGATTPIIASVCTTNTLTQGEQLQVNYVCYDPSNMSTDVTLIVSQNGEMYSEITRTVDATKQTWNTRDLPVGEVTLTISYGVISRTHTITVLENDISISIKTTDLKFNLTAAGKSNTDDDRDVWESNGVIVDFQDINWDSTGWVVDDDGDTALRLSGEATAIIDYEPFKEDARQRGLTIELTFAIRDVNNRESIAVQCLHENIGFSITADTAKLSSEQSAVSCQYGDETKLSVSFVIEPKSEYRLMQIYLNGISSDSVQYSDTDNLQQVSPSKIIIGSPYCCIDLYSVRAYDMALTSREIQNNYIASITNLNKKNALYADNDIYDAYGNLSFSDLTKKIPVMVVQGELPKSKGDKKAVHVIYTDPVNSIYNFEDDGTIDVQGTSSQYFVRKNWKIKTKSDHQFAEGQLSDNVYCMKTNYMDSSCGHNTGGANYAHFLYDTKTPPQIENELIRSTIYGHPCVMFHKVDSSSPLEFIGRYNFNWDKGSDVYGFSSDYPLAQSIEFCNNTSDACLFHGSIPDAWGDDFEFRHPDGGTDISAFKVAHDWVVSTWQDGATGNTLDVEYVAYDGTVYVSDTAEYRLAKFITEFEQHFDLDYTTMYYVFCNVLLLADNMAKNMFMTTWDGVHFAPWLYDLDTMLGVNNEGQNVLNPWLLDTDTINNADAVNGKNSAFWQNFREGFADTIKSYYQEKRSSGKISYDTIIKFIVEEQIQKFCMSVCNQDIDYKYISMLRSDNDASNLHLAKGTWEEYIKFFVKSRIDFLDGYWEASDYIDDYISLRIYTPDGDLVVEPDATFNVVPYSDSFVGLKIKANGTLLKQRAKANDVVTFTDKKTETYNDTETAIFPASEISSLGDLSPLYCGSVKVEKAAKLTELIIGSGADGYCNSNLHELSVGTNKLLKTIDIRNCPNYSAALDLSACPNVQNIYATGSSITSVTLPPSGYLRKIYLPGTITNLTLTNQQYITDFQCESYDSLTTLRVEQTSGVPVEDIMLNAPNLNRIRLIDVSWTAESEAALVQTIEKFKSCLGLDANGANTDIAVITGRVKVNEAVSDEVIGDIYNSFPNLVIDDGSGDIYIINYKDWDGTILHTLRLAEGEDAYDPIATNEISEPFRESDEYYSYEFVGWNMIPTNVNKHYQVIAQYHTKVAVNFCVDDVIIHSEYVIYGASAEDPVANGTIEIPIKEGTDDLRYVFNGWDKSLQNVTLPRNINAIWSNVYPVRFYATESSTAPHYVQWVKDGEDAHDPVAANECVAPSDIVTEDITYVFSNWDTIPTNVTAIMKVYAEYSPFWAVRFYNGYILEDTQWIPTGGSAVDPVKSGRIVTPTCESTAQYDYAFSGWEGDYTNVTYPRKIMAKYSATVRRYNVYFYNDDELLQTVENVPYGTAKVSYTGVTPVKTGVDNPEEYVFKGWMPAPENITGETTCYALFKFTGYIFGKLSDDSEYGTVDNPNWSAINAYWTTIGNDVEAYTDGSMSKDDFYTKYQIGGRMIVPITLSDGISTVADVEIIARDHDDLTSVSGKAPLTFFCKDLPQITKVMNTEMVNAGGWESCEMRTFTNGELFGALPQELKLLIKLVDKISDGGSTYKALVTTHDKVWLASYDEVGFIDDATYGLLGQGAWYKDVFPTKDSRVKTIVDNTSAAGWWLRSSHYGSIDSSLFIQVTKTGGKYCFFPSSALYVAFGFCI